MRVGGLFLLLNFATMLARAAEPGWVVVHPSGGKEQGYDRFVEREGIVVALPGMAVSMDGGLNWENREALGDFEDADLAGRSLWISAGFGTGSISISTDGGRAWDSPQTRLEGGLSIARLFDERRGFGIGDEVLLTDDGGKSWRQPSPPVPVVKAPRPRTVHRLDEKRAWIALSVNRGVSVLSTGDRGRTWLGSNLPDVGSPNAMAFVDAKRGWLVTSSFDEQRAALWRTIDGGLKWAKTGLSAEVARRVESMAMKDEREGWVAGPGVLFHTRDGGMTWTGVEAPSSSSADAVALHYGRAKDGEYLLFGTYEPVVEPAEFEGGKETVLPDGAIYRRLLKR